MNRILKTIYHGVYQYLCFNLTKNLYCRHLQATNILQTTMGRYRIFVGNTQLLQCRSNNMILKIEQNTGFPYKYIRIQNATIRIQMICLDAGAKKMYITLYRCRSVYWRTTDEKEDGYNVRVYRHLCTYIMRYYNIMYKADVPAAI